MNKCLVTKLNGVVNNDAILKIGRMRVLFSKLKGESFQFKYNVNEEVIVEKGYITDSSYAQNNGQNLLCEPHMQKGFYLTADAGEISINMGYYDLDLFVAPPGSSFDIDKLCYSKLSSLTANYCQFNTSKFPKSMPYINVLNLQGTNIEDDIAAISNYSKIELLNLKDCYECYGNISALSNLSSLYSCILTNTKVKGDISTLPASVRFLSLGSSQKVDWLTTRPSDSHILALENVYLGDSVNAMLINQANCSKMYESSDPSWFKTISCIGTRTSASDAALATLQQKGYTISVTPA